MRLRRIISLAAACAVLAGAALPAVASAHGRPPSEGSSVPRYKHIFVIVMENHSFDQVFNNVNTPQINALARTYGVATDYFGITHPSEPNYVALAGGNFFGIQDDAPFSATSPVSHTINQPSLADQLDGAGLSWKEYLQALSSPGYFGTRSPTSGPTLYVSKHNPFINFAGIQNNPADLAKMVPDTQLQTDLRSGRVPNFSFIAPDQCHDMHGTTGCSDDTGLLQAGDAYVGSTVSAITSSRFWHKGRNAIVITWDENDFSTDTPNGCCDADGSKPGDGGGGGHVLTIVITSHGPRGVQDATPFNHYSLLRTIHDAFRLDCLQFTCDRANVTPMSALFGGNDSGDD